MKKLMMALLLGVGAASVPVAPAQAVPVFDSANYSQNLLTAARTLQQINQQIQSLQNEAQMLVNQQKNLSRIDFPQMAALQRRLADIDRLMGQAQGIDEQFRQAFPTSFENLATRDGRIAAAKARLEAEMASFRQAMSVQSGIVENVRDDAEALRAIVDRSQGAEGGLQAAQATNQLLALAAKQQFQIQQLMSTQFREQTLERARRAQVEREARESTRRFLGDGKAWTPPR